MRTLKDCSVNPFLLPTVAFALSGCGHMTSTLKPVEVAQDCTSASDQSGKIYCLDLAAMGAACDADGAAVAANTLEKFSPPFPAPYAGWDDAYDPGTEPAPCWEWVSTFSRAYVRFDLSKLLDATEIYSAALTWKTKRIKGGPSGSSCIKSLYEATGPWKRGNTPSVLLFDNLDTVAVKAGYFGVVDQAKKWFAEPQKNFGFMFVPKRAHTAEKSNDECVDALQDLRLVVKWHQESPKWPK